MRAKELIVFKNHITQFNQPIKDFLNDFKAWPQEEKSKMITFNDAHGKGYIFNDRPATTDNPKYKGNVGFCLDCNLYYHQLEQFLWTIEYLKNSKDK